MRRLRFRTTDTPQLYIYDIGFINDQAEGEKQYLAYRVSFISRGKRLTKQYLVNALTGELVDESQVDSGSVKVTVCVSERDIELWKKNYGKVKARGELAGDVNGDLIVDLADYSAIMKALHSGNCEIDPQQASNSEEEATNAPIQRAIDGFPNFLFDISDFDCSGSWLEEFDSSSENGSFFTTNSTDTNDNCLAFFSNVDAGRYQIYASYNPFAVFSPAFEVSYKLLLDGELFTEVIVDQSFFEPAIGLGNTDYSLIFDEVLPAASSVEVLVGPSDFSAGGDIIADALFIEEFECFVPVGLLSGDGNFDGRVDAADYTVWRDNYGRTEFACPEQGDYNRDGVTDAADYTVWRNNYGAVAPPAPSDFSILEPVDLITSGTTENVTPTFTWENSPNAAGYQIRLSNGSVPSCSTDIIEFEQVASDVTSYTVPNALSDGQSYSFCVFAQNFNGSTAALNSAVQFTVQLPIEVEFNILEPIPLAFDPREPITWEPAEGATSYTLQVDRFAPKEEIGSINVSGITGTSYTIPSDQRGLLNGNHSIRLWAEINGQMVEATNSPALFNLTVTRIFVTDDLFTPGPTDDPAFFLGLGGASRTCQRVGQDEEEHIFPSERFVGLIGDTNSPVVARMGPFTRAIYDLFGDLVAVDGPTMVNQGPMVGITLTEDFNRISGRAWTGAIIGGSIGNTCSNWSSANSNSFGSVGIADDTNGTNAFWIGGLPPAIPQVERCNTSNRLFCIGPIPSPLPRD